MQPQRIEAMDHDHTDDQTAGAFAHPRAGSSYQLVLRGEVVTPRLVKADTTWSRMRGLLGRGGLAPSEGLWIEPCKAIHMYFMRFPIDAVFLDKSHTVVRVWEDLRPWRMANGGKFAHSVLELPQGKAAFYNLRVGDRVMIVPEE